MQTRREHRDWSEVTRLAGLRPSVASPEREMPRSDRPFVRWVQRALNRVIGTRLVVDGLVGPNTWAAVKRFQRTFALPVDGRVGADTQAMLITVSASLPPATPVIAPPTGPAPARPWRTFQLTHFGPHDAGLTREHVAKILNEIAPFIMRHKGRLARVEVIGFATGTTRTGRHMATARVRATNARQSLVHNLRERWRARSSVLAKIRLATGHRFIPVPAGAGTDPAHRKVAIQVFVTP